MRSAAFNDLLDAEQDRFVARQRHLSRRNGLMAVIGALLVVGIGIWGFGIETNTRLAPIHWRKLAPSITVAISPH